MSYLCIVLHLYDSVYWPYFIKLINKYKELVVEFDNVDEYKLLVIHPLGTFHERSILLLIKFQISKYYNFLNLKDGIN